MIAINGVPVVREEDAALPGKEGHPQSKSKIKIHRSWKKRTHHELTCVLIPSLSSASPCRGRARAEFTFLQRDRINAQ